MSRKLCIAVAVVLAVLLVVDVAAKSYAQAAVASAIRARVQNVSEVDARIHSFPFIGRLVVGGDVSDLDITLHGVTGHGVDVARLEVDGTGIVLDRNVLLGKHHVRIRNVDTVTATATIEVDAIRTLTGIGVELNGVAVNVVDGRVHVGAVSFRVPDADLLPCQVHGRVVDGAIELACTTHQLPKIVIDAVGATDLLPQRSR